MLEDVSARAEDIVLYLPLLPMVIAPAGGDEAASATGPVMRLSKRVIRKFQFHILERFMKNRRATRRRTIAVLYLYPLFTQAETIVPLADRSIINAVV